MRAFHGMLGRRAVLAAGRYRIAEEMFQARGDVLRMVHIVVVAFLSFHQFAAQHRAEIGIFAEALVLAREARSAPRSRIGAKFHGMLQARIS